uniref:Uncharacterized protein n=1 Tax=Chromera velia CCMP2878 TaxID=1169474 RepID=A0A0G4IAI0_9ALVE|eukprot:Cvel_12554.t1-p1 / transcript=Cvel_12554.t1 / gene=Cvel_12554 / organism=Chromera_velia_CCMP2878 / gene_product=hypothetical protein / transcript_product=hypothetical protein / location=Cvel_scaffold825:47292-47516(-) / protein_length=75 / sequence_SO=supercontig / SO=protein_coding / is_pseudo=false
MQYWLEKEGGEDSGSSQSPDRGAFQEGHLSFHQHDWKLDEEEEGHPGLVHKGCATGIEKVRMTQTRDKKGCKRCG